MYTLMVRNHVRFTCTACNVVLVQMYIIIMPVTTCITTCSTCKICIQVPCMSGVSGVLVHVPVASCVPLLVQLLIELK